MEYGLKSHVSGSRDRGMEGDAGRVRDGGGWRRVRDGGDEG